MGVSEYETNILERNVKQQTSAKLYKEHCVNIAGTHALTSPQHDGYKNLRFDPLLNRMEPTL